MKGLLLNNWRLKLVALLVAVGLWLYIYKEHNPRFSITLSVPITYVNQDNSLHIAKSPDRVDVKFNGSPEQIQTIDPSKVRAEADLSHMSAGRHSVTLRVHHQSRAEAVDSNLRVTLTLERLNSIERPLTVIPIGSLPIDKRLGTLRPSLDVITFYGFESILNKVTDATVSLYLTEQKKSFSMRLRVEARDKFGNVISGVTAEPEEVTVDVAVNNANTRIVPVTVNFNRALDTTRVVAQYTPTSVTLFGKEKSLQSIENLSTDTVDANRCVPGASFDADIHLPRNVFSSDDTVTITCEEPRTVDRIFTVNIEAVNVPEGFSATLGKSKIEVGITGDAVVLDQLNLEQIKAQVDMSGFQVSGRVSVKPRVTVNETRGNLSLTFDDSPIPVTLTKK